MVHGPLLGKILLFSLPLIAQSWLQVLFNAADVIVVGRFVGPTALAAVGCTASLVNLILNVFMGLSVGANVVVARYLGAKNDVAIEQSVHTTIGLSVLSGIILTVIGFFGSPVFLIWMSTPAEVLPQATLYLRVYFLGIISSMLYNFGAAILRAIGDTQRPLIFLLISGVLNVILNVIFVTVIRLDVAGVALATIISQTLAAYLVLRCLTREKSSIRLNFKKIQINVERTKEIVKIGMPAGVQGMLFSFSNTVIQSSINGFGAVVVAGNSAASNVEGFVWNAMNAFHQASTSFTSQNYGAGEMKRINIIAVQCQLCAIVISLISSMAFLWGGPFIMSLYSPEADVIAAGMVRLKIIMSTYYLCGMMDVMVGSLRGIGYSIIPMIMSLLGACGLRLLFIFTLFRLPYFHTTDWLYYMYPISWAVTFVAQFVTFLICKRKVDRQYSMVSAV